MPIKRHVIVASVYALVALLCLYPIVFGTGSLVAGYDYFHFHWNFWWTREALTSDLPLYYTNYVMAPFVTNLSYHTLSLMWFPVWAALEPLVGTFTAMTVILMIGCFLNGYVFCLYLWKDEKVALSLAILGGIVLQVLPVVRYFYYNTHLNLMVWFWIPVHLMLWRRVVRSVEAGETRRTLLWGMAQGVGLWLMVITDLQFPIFLAFLLVPYGLYTVYRAEKRARLLASAVSVVALGVGLLWVAGPLQAILAFEGSLVPGMVDDRPGVPLEGLLLVQDRWWYWDTPTPGGFVPLLVVVALIVSLIRRRQPQPNNPMDSTRWLWFALCIPPLLIALGPAIRGTEVDLPPYRLLFDLTGGNFRMPWRLIPVFVIAGMIFTAKTLTPLVVSLPVRGRVFVFVGVILLASASLRLYQPGEVQPRLREYDFYTAMGAEPYDYVVIEAPTGAGTGEMLVGNVDAVAYQFYGIRHGKRMVNGFIARAPLEHFWLIQQDDTLLSWLGQRRALEPQAVEARLQEIIPDWEIGYFVIHQDAIPQDAQQELFAYFNSLPELLCPVWVEGTTVVYRTAWHPDGCPPRTPPQDESGGYQIDIGTAHDAPHIGAGWHYTEALGGVTVRWAGSAPRTMLYADLPAGTYDLTLTMQAFHEEREVTVLIDGEPQATFTVSTAGLSTHTTRVDLPGGAFTLALDYDATLTPQAVGLGDDTRALAVMVDTVRFDPVG